MFETITITISSGLIGGFISFYFAQKTEKYKFAQLQKQKAEAVARLFSKWIKYSEEEIKRLNEEQLSDYYEELNRMSIEVSFWIKDQKLLTDIMIRLQNDPSSKNIREIIGEVRKLILENPKDVFDAQKITLWPKR